MVVVPTPTSPDAHPLSSRLATCAISLRSSGSNVGVPEVYPRVEDTPPPSRSQCQSLEDSLRFQVEEDLESGVPSKEGHGVPFHDARSGLLVEVSRHDDCEGKVGEGRGEEALDYGSTPEWEALEGGPVRPQLQSEVHVVQHDSNGSDEVFILILPFL